MKALRKLAGGEGHVELVEISTPSPGPGQVLLKVKSVGICGTDLHIWEGRFDKVRPPVTLGHEFAGEVAQLGPGVSGWQTGQRVVSESQAYSCGVCVYCGQGQSNLCPERLAYGYGVDGGMAEYAVVRADGLHALPEGVSFQQGAMVEPLAVAVHAVLERGVAFDHGPALVSGPGPIGLLVLLVLAQAGVPALVCGTSKDQARLDLAARLGAGEVVMVDRQDLGQAAQEFTKGQGFAVAWECSGAGAALSAALANVRRQGQVVQVGLAGGAARVDLDQLTLKEVVLRGAFVHNRQTWERSLALLGDGSLDLRPLISAELPLSHWQRAFELSRDQAGVKYLLRPGE
ncbi:MAG: alcohol dehydrogenase catalytic domain-containing protein [Proteobacteria bacterium]|nr:alcohol dehydrogenase catalytic domain-containing protein [Pseudomonadota bacterium]